MSGSGADVASRAAESKAVAGLRHVNIVQVYDIGDHESRPYFTMELVEGGTLAQQLQGTPQPARQAAAGARMEARLIANM